jgi:hypothetical protein
MAGVNRFKTVSWENYLNNGFYFLIMRKNTKSQAAMEFLMTYGWALLVVLIVIAALAYFGLLNPSRFLPDRVDLSPGLEVRTASVDENSIVMIIQNNMGKPLFNLQINATECNGSRGVLSDPIHLPDGKTERIIINCGDTSPVGSKFNSNLRVNYSTRTLSNTLTHSRTGKIVVTVNRGNTTFDYCIDGEVFCRGTGTSQDPYQIYTLEHLNKTRDYLDAYFILARDLDFNDCSSYDNCDNMLGFTTGSGWQPIGTSFVGSFDGQNHTISGLFIDKDSTNNIGLFSVVGAGGNINNIGIINTNISGKDNSGILVGRLFGSIYNSYTNGSLKGNTEVGGLVGNAPAGSIVNLSHSNASVYGLSYSVGGLIGTSFGRVISSYATGNVIGEKDYNGGLLGGLALSGRIISSYATGNVTGNWAGGLVGLTNRGNITNSYATGSVQGNRVGGLVGCNGYSSWGTQGSSINNSYSVGIISGTNTGGLVSHNNGVVTNSYWDIDSSGMAASAAGTGVNEDGEEPEYFYNLSQPVYTSTEPYWDFDTVWSNSNNMTGYPILKWQE